MFSFALTHPSGEQTPTADIQFVVQETCSSHTRHSLVVRVRDAVPVAEGPAEHGGVAVVPVVPAHAPGEPDGAHLHPTRVVTRPRRSDAERVD